MASLKTTKTNGTVPTNYMLCLKSDCPQATTCLRYTATEMMPTRKTISGNFNLLLSLL